MRIGFFTARKAIDQNPYYGVSGESVFVYWLGASTVADVVAMDKEDIKATHPDYDFLVIDQAVDRVICRNDIPFPKNRSIYWSYANTPNNIISKLGEYAFVLHNNKYLSSHFQHERLIYIPFACPAVEPKQDKIDKFIYVGNYNTYMRKFTDVLRTLQGQVDIYGNSSWASDFPNEYKGTIDLPNLTHVYNSYRFSLCLHKPINRIFGEWNLSYPMSIACGNSFYIDIDMPLSGGRIQLTKQPASEQKITEGCRYAQKNDIDHFIDSLIQHVSEYDYLWGTTEAITKTVNDPLVEIDDTLYRQIFVNEGDSLYGMLGHNWKSIYDLSVNASFRTANDNPHSLIIGSMIYVPYA